MCEDEASDGGGDQVPHNRAKFGDTAKHVTDHGLTVVGLARAGCSFLNMQSVFGCIKRCLHDNGPLERCTV